VVTPDSDSTANITVDVAANAAIDVLGNKSSVAIQNIQTVDTKNRPAAEVQTTEKNTIVVEPTTAPVPVFTIPAETTATEPVPENPVQGQTKGLTDETGINTDVTLNNGSEPSVDQIMKDVANQISNTLSFTNTPVDANISIRGQLSAVINNLSLSDSTNSQAAHSKASVPENEHSEVLDTIMGNNNLEQSIFKVLGNDKSIDINGIKQQLKELNLDLFDIDKDGMIDKDELEKILDKLNADEKESALLSLQNSTHTLESAQQRPVAFQSSLERSLIKLLT